MSGTRKPKSKANVANRSSERKAPEPHRSSARAEYHAVRFYEDDKALARIVADFLNEGFKRGDPAIVVAKADQRAEIVQVLTDRSCDVVALQRADDLVLLDAEQTLSTFMIDGK